MRRINFDISDVHMESLKELQRKIGVATMKDLFNNAVTILEWAVEETAHGNEIAAVNEEAKVYRVLATPPLQHVAREYRRDHEAASVG